jgi:cobalt-zinc-cadmium efflux system outer membrane protein
LLLAALSLDEDDRLSFLDFFPSASARRSVLGVTLLLSGCVSQGNWPQPEQDAATSTGLSQPIRFDRTAGVTDLPDAPPQTLTLPAAVEKALTTNPQLQAALARVRSAQAEARQSRLLPNPVLSVAVRYPEGGGKPTVEAGLAADLLSLLQRPGRVSAADHRLRAASAEAVSTALDVLKEVQERYFAVQALDELTPVLEARRKLLDRLLDISRSRLRAGEGTQLDVTTLESQRVELDLEIAEKQLELREERLALARLLGQPSGAADWKLTPFNAARTPLVAERDWIALALERRPEIQARKWEVAALGGDLSAARFAAIEGGDAGIDAERDDGWGVGPAVSSPLPIFDWGQARREKLRADRTEAMHKLTEERRRVVEEVRRAHAAYGVLTDALAQARDRLIPLMQKRLEQAEGQYLSGQADITALALAEQELQAARARRIELERRAFEALSRLQRAVGGPGVARRIAAPTTAPATMPATTPATTTTTGR